MSTDEGGESRQLTAELRIKRPLNEVTTAMQELREMLDLPLLLTAPTSEAENSKDMKIVGGILEE